LGRSGEAVEEKLGTIVKIGTGGLGGGLPAKGSREDSKRRTGNGGLRGKREV